MKAEKLMNVEDVYQVGELPAAKNRNTRASGSAEHDTEYVLNCVCCTTVCTCGADCGTTPLRGWPLWTSRAEMPVRKHVQKCGAVVGKGGLVWYDVPLAGYSSSDGILFASLVGFNVASAKLFGGVAGLLDRHELDNRRVFLRVPAAAAAAAAAVVELVAGL